jgi:undecaprenyl-phosphate 4-deoxy-4-formamido-L-arabinose transferase
VVLPVFNEEGTIAEVLARTRRVLEQRGEPFEIVVVDDGSTDRTPALLAEEAARDPRLRIFTFTRNFGQAAALACGLFAARGERVLTLDADLQNPPEEIPKLLDALQPGVDMVSGLRAVRPEPWWRFFGSRAVHWIARLLVGRRLGDYGGQFKLYRRSVIDTTRRAWAPGKPFFALAVWLGFRVVEVPVQHEQRRHGRSRYGWWSLLRLNLDIITSFTTAPLVLLCFTAAAAAAVLSLFALAVLWQPAWAAGAVPLALCGLAVLLLTASAAGLYIAQLYRRLSGPKLGFVLRAPAREESAPAPLRATRSEAEHRDAGELD